MAPIRKAGSAGSRPVAKAAAGKKVAAKPIARQKPAPIRKAGSAGSRPVAKAAAGKAEAKAKRAENLSIRRPKLSAEERAKRLEERKSRATSRPKVSAEERAKRLEERKARATKNRATTFGRYRTAADGSPVITRSAAVDF